MSLARLGPRSLSALLLTPVLVVAMGPAASAWCRKPPPPPKPPAATQLTIDAVSDQAGVGVLTQGSAFDVVVTARDTSGSPAAYTGTVTLTATGGSGTTLGTLTGTTTATLSKATTATVAGAVYTGYGNGITLTAAASGLTSGTTTIDVSLLAASVDATPGTGTSLTPPGCAEATTDVPVCSTLQLPNGANGRVTLSQGSCAGVTSCLTGSQNQALVVDAVADVEGLYTRSHPATVKLQCDKSLCTKGSAKDYPILFQPTGSDSFVTVPVCAKRGTIGADQEFCQDVRASSCRGRGDLVTYLLFLSDLKTTFR